MLSLLMQHGQPINDEVTFFFLYTVVIQQCISNERLEFLRASTKKVLSLPMNMLMAEVKLLINEYLLSALLSGTH